MGIYLNMKQYTKSTNKYKNKECIYNGIKFQSLREKNYYIKLKMLQNSGKISELKLQVPFVLIETFKLEDKTYRQTKYVADFVYKDEQGKYHIVDTKGFRTPEYKLKKKLMAWKYGIEIEEI